MTTIVAVRHNLYAITATLRHLSLTSPVIFHEDDRKAIPSIGADHA